MTYLISDIHGEYDLFLRLLDRIGFSDEDEMIILGDVIDKGAQSVRLLRFIRRQPNVTTILGNHEYDFLKYKYSLERSHRGDAAAVMRKLREYFSADTETMTSAETEYIESLMPFWETDEYLCVHAGVETDSFGKILPLDLQSPEVLVYDRRFKDAERVLAPTEKTVIFGHTPCVYDEPTATFIKTPKKNVAVPKKISDFSKIRLDCGVYVTGKLGTLRVEDLCEFFVSVY